MTGSLCPCSQSDGSLRAQFNNGTYVDAPSREYLASAKNRRLNNLIPAENQCFSYGYAIPGAAP
jgi:hypothetical protein